MMFPSIVGCSFLAPLLLVLSLISPNDSRDLPETELHSVRTVPGLRTVSLSPRAVLFFGAWRLQDDMDNVKDSENWWVRG